MYIYIKSEPGLWTVGFYDPQGVFQSESDHDSKEEAARRVHWLNGGTAEHYIELLKRISQASGGN